MLSSETDLVARLKASRLGALCKVDTLPALNERALATLLKAAPAMYVSLRGARVNGDTMQLDISIWVLARSYRAHRTGRQGDALSIGLYELAEAVLSVLFSSPGYMPQGFRADNGEFVDDHGIYSGEITLTTTVDVPVDEDTLNTLLAPFTTFHDYLDAPPFDSAAEHAKWLAGDQTTSKPDAEDHVTLPQ